MSRPTILLFARIPLAGPSRAPLTPQTLRNIHTTCLRRATTVKRVPNKTTSPAQTTSTPPRASRIVAEAKSLWRPMGSNVKGVKAEEILLFSRPFEAGKYTKHHLFFPVLTGATVIYTSLYAVYMVQAYFYPPPDVRTYNGWMADASKTILTVFGPFALLAMTLACTTVGTAQFRTITRLAKVRLTTTTPTGGEEVKEFVRMVHGGHLINMGLFPRYRDIPADKISLYDIDGIAIRLDIDEVGRRNRGYQMLMVSTPLMEQSEDDVVVSRRRLEDNLKPVVPITAKVLSEDTTIWKRMDKWLGYDREKPKSA